MNQEYNTVELDHNTVNLDHRQRFEDEKMMTASSFYTKQFCR